MLNEDKYKRSITIHCPTCGHTQFEYEPENRNDATLMKCASCQLTLTKAQLVEVNSENISEHVSEMGNELVADLTKDLRRLFGGGKFLK
jgi:hypothetical protein